MISTNSSLSKPVPLFNSAKATDASRGVPEPKAAIESTPVEFSGTGGEYFRIWIVNLLLIIVTFGIYYPWAKVRKLKYFYNNTRIDDHALEFHGEPKKMLRGTLIAGVLFSMYSVSANFSPIAGIMVLLALIGIAPLLFRSAMRFRLANTSWRGIRMRFTATDLKEPYAVILLPLAVAIVFGLVLAVLKAGIEVISASAASFIVDAYQLIWAVVIAAVFPYFFWRLKRYQHNHYAWGPLITEYRSSVIDTYKVSAMTVAISLLIAAVFLLAAKAVIPNQFSSIRHSRDLWSFLALLIPLIIAFTITINILPRAFFTAAMQNLLWSRTGNRYFRFKSALPVGKFIGLQFKNYFLILITFGLYWPFAVIATQRMKLEAVSLKTRVALDKLSDAARARENDAAGDMAADLFGFDVGM